MWATLFLDLPNTLVNLDMLESGALVAIEEKDISSSGLKFYPQFSFSWMSSPSPVLFTVSYIIMSRFLFQVLHLHCPWDPMSHLILWILTASLFSHGLHHGMLLASWKHEPEQNFLNYKWRSGMYLSWLYLLSIQGFQFNPQHRVKQTWWWMPVILTLRW